MRKILLDKTYNIIDTAIKQEIAHVSMDDEPFAGNNIRYSEKELTGFIFCDYLGLSVDERLKLAANEAVAKYGVFTSVSRTYLKLGIYEEAEKLMSQIFGKPVILVTRTSLGHLAALPVITDKDDAILLDHYVHTSVRNGADILRGYGNYVETVRHNNVERLEERILQLSNQYKRIWYLADGVYSMHGDTLPARGIKKLLDKYEQFRLYVDDAHGMSWTGRNGKGYVLANMEYHPRMFLITSLAKGFGTGGSAIVCPDERTRDYILFDGPPLIFSGPITPPTLGAIIASAKIHLSKEIIKKQKKLQSLVGFFLEKAKEYELPLIAGNETPIFFVPSGKPDMTTEIASNMKNHGYFVTGGVYPAVPYNNSGIRPILSLHHNETEIEGFIQALSHELNKAIYTRNISMDEILRYYKGYASPGNS
jgi:7-keto-8-aminopelargonate synthetase-like enzyme